jgi:hypothetical protein
MCKNYNCEDALKNETQQKEEKIVNLFEDCGNFHDEEKLQKSYEKISEKDKNNITQ